MIKTNRRHFNILELAVNVYWIILPTLLTILQFWASFLFCNDHPATHPVEIIGFTLLLLVVIIGTIVCSPFGLIPIMCLAAGVFANIVIAVYSIFGTVSFNSDWFLGINYLFGKHTELIYKVIGGISSIPVGLFIIIVIVGMIYPKIYNEND